MYLLGPGTVLQTDTVTQNDTVSQKETTDQTTALPELIPQAQGGALRAGGTPGNKGGGKHPDAFRALMREIATKAAEVAAANIVGNDRHPAFLGAAKWSSEHGYGRPVETREYSGTVTVRVVRDTGPIVEPEQIEDGEAG